MSKINLLPDELLVKKGTKKIASTSKNVAIVGFGLFFLSVFAAISYFVILSFQLRNLNEEQEGLKVSVRALEQTEQQIVLVKDRLEKAIKILGDNSTEASVVSFDKNVLSNLPPGVIITEAKVAEEKSSVSFVVTSSTSLSSLLGSLVASKDFDRIRLESLSFSPAVGYLVSMELFGFPDAGSLGQR